MHRIDTSTAQVDKFGAGKNGFSAGNPQTGTPATDLDEAFFDMLQEELAAVVESSGATLDKTKHNQLLTALKALLLSRATPFADIKADGTTATALANLGLKEAASGVAIVGTARNAKMSITAASASATFTADEVVVSTALGGKLYRRAGFNKTINLAASGAGGMDTGSAPSTGYVALYAIYNPTTDTDALLAVNATSSRAPEVYGGSNMPSGYTASALVSVWRTASSQFVIGFQVGRHISIMLGNVFTTATGVTTVQGVSFALLVPLNAVSIDAYIAAYQTTASIGVELRLYSSSTKIGQITANSSVSGATAVSLQCSVMDVVDPQALYFDMANANTGTYVINCRGYTI